MKTAKIEIFKKGRYGDSESRIWSDREVDELVDNYDTGFRSAPIILGHNSLWSETEKPAMGWVQKLEKNSKGIVEAIIEYNEELEELVKKKKYKNVSIEVVKKIELIDEEADKEGAYLLAVAFLGGSQPAVSGLKPVEFSADYKKYASNFTFDADLNPQSEPQQKEQMQSEAQTVKEGGEADPKKDDTIQHNNTQGAEMTVEQLKAKETELAQMQADLSAKEAELAQKEEHFKAEAKKREIAQFIADNQKKILPTEKDSIEDFMTKLDDDALEAFKKQITARADLKIFDELTDGKNEDAHLDTDAKFALQAKKDLDALK
jgi:hypothetical protein